MIVTQARSVLDGIQPGDAATVERHRQAVELVTEIDHLDDVLRDSRTRITAAVAASGTTLTEIFGVGPIVAAMLIGYSGDPTRFATASRYAAYTGCAPIEFSSGGRTTHRLSSGAATGGSTTPCTARRSPRSATATAPGAATTTASSPRARPHAKRSALSNDDSATSSGDTSSLTPNAPTLTEQRARAGQTRERLCRLRDRLTPCNTGSSAQSLPGPEPNPRTTGRHHRPGQPPRAPTAARHPLDNKEVIARARHCARRR